MDIQQVPMFKEWFIDTYPECKDYLDLTYFDVEKNAFIAKCSYNPDSGNAAKVLRIAFGSWQHQQAKVEEQAQEIANLKSLIQGHELRHQQNLSIKQKLTRRSEELQKRVDSLEKAEFKLAQVKAILQNNPKLLESILIKKIEQALKGEGQ
ncbi:hypothetical protein [Acinetobacter baumannii]|uniref:hypothetical protein n=1 Tax=Acinetobacter baumannii TaxID=470 RepID=UPI000448C488|nr:hypothetical protein [Acinetobacter baumannii]EXR21469.1 hypothetical protein J669_1801 [Acinetobacter baumannii 1295549]EXR93226.1 hypothetical protein J680_0433 [Acinetobacter baumannii 277047]EXS39855.1 hypothetical protein J677_0615 [Acinetobacter baumannii 426863]